MKITFVKKILSDGSPCAKCADVLEKLEASGQMSRIDAVITADERDPTTEGMQIAKRYNVDRAPFFVVENEGKPVQIYTVYLKFVKEVLQEKTSERDELKEIMQNNSDLDFL
jgi:predicted DsbA family dithiol-disulfide isomerase